MPDEPLTTEPGTSAGGDLAPQEAVVPGQPDQQSQEPGGSQVETPPTDAPSTQGSKRPHPAWADQRVIRKIVGEALGSHLKDQLPSILEEFRSAQQPSVPQTQTPEQPDYNDLNGWLNKKVETLLQERLKQELPKDLNQFKEKMTDDFKRTTATQEARNYLISQGDIGRDKAKHEEIEQYMIDNLLDISFRVEPLKATQLAVDGWRNSKKNPNTPSKAQLSTVSGGAPGQPKKELSVAELVELQRKIASGPTIDEKAKLEAQIESLIAS